MLMALLESGEIGRRQHGAVERIAMLVAKGEQPTFSEWHLVEALYEQCIVSEEVAA